MVEGALALLCIQEGDAAAGYIIKTSCYFQFTLIFKLPDNGTLPSDLLY